MSVRTEKLKDGYQAHHTNIWNFLYLSTWQESHPNVFSALLLSQSSRTRLKWVVLFGHAENVNERLNNIWRGPWTFQFLFYLINCVYHRHHHRHRRHSEQACWIFGIGHIIIKLFAVYNGLLVFAKYSSEKCDPVFNGDVAKYDQIFPYYVMDIARNIPGLPGLFIVGALSAALSSMSSCLNALSGTVYEDFLKPYLPNASEKQASSIMKFITFFLGRFFPKHREIAMCRYEKAFFQFSSLAFQAAYALAWSS